MSLFIKLEATSHEKTNQKDTMYFAGCVFLDVDDGNGCKRIDEPQLELPGKAALWGRV